jgi:hypothetical protein
MKIESEISSKCVIGIWGLHKRPSTHLGGVSFSIVEYTHFYENELCCHQSQKEGDWKCILAPNCFGDSDKHNLCDLMLDQDVCKT